MCVCVCRTRLVPVCHSRCMYMYTCVIATFTLPPWLKGQHLRRDANTWQLWYALADTSVRNTHARKRRACIYVPSCTLVFTEHVRGETISYARTTGEVGPSERFSPARYYAGIDNAELVNAFPDQCAPFIDHTRKDLARTSTTTFPPSPSSSQPLCAPRPKFVVVAVRRVR